MKLPNEIINKIMVYIAEINHNMIITQFNLTNKKNKEYYLINKNSDLLWNIHGIIYMKLIYPFHILDSSLYVQWYPTTQGNMELMKFGKKYYSEKARNETNKKL